MAPTATETPATATATSTPEPTPTPVLPNTDSIAATSGTGPFSLQQAGEQTVTYTYTVTTPRVATTIHAELRHADGSLATAWWLQGQAGTSGWLGNGGVLDLVDYGTVAPGGAIPVTFTVTAPAEVSAEHGVTLYLRSVAATDRGEEAGVAERAVGSFTAVPPPTPVPTETPTPMATETPTPTPEPETAECVLASASTEVASGEAIEYRCTTNTAPLHLVGGKPTKGWEAGVQFDGEKAITWFPAGTGFDLTGGEGVLEASVYLRPTSTVKDGAAGAMTMDVIGTDGSVIAFENVEVAFKATATTQTRLAAAATGVTCVVTPPTVVPNMTVVKWTCTVDQAPMKVNVLPLIEDGWEYRVTIGGNTTAWTSAGTFSSSASGNDTVAIIEVRPFNSNALPGETITFPAIFGKPNYDPAGNTNQQQAILGTWDISATRDLSGTQFSLACTDPVTAVTNATGSVTCDLNATNISPMANVGWNVSPLSLPTGWTLVSGPLQSSGIYPTAKSFTFSLQPFCGAANSSSLTVSVSLTFMGGPAGTVQDSITLIHDTSSSLSVSIASSNLTWTQSYSFSPFETNPGDLTYNVTSSGCGDWHVNVSATDFAYNGSPTNIDISASDLEITSVTDPTNTSVQPGTAATGTLDQIRTVLVGSDILGTYTQTLDFNLYIPGGARAGTHISTITIAAESGP